MKLKPRNPKIDSRYVELREEDSKYSEKKYERIQPLQRQKRPIRNLTRAWMEHVDDFDEVDEFYGQ